MNLQKEVLTPTSSSERIVSIDVLRGIAVLGILIMNIQSFTMISEAYINPTAYGDLTGINKWVWVSSQLIASSKFMAIFSMLFGAGVIIFTTRASEKGKNVAKLFYSRTFWLLIFGLIHAYCIWYGDILTTYALCGFLVFFFRKMKPKMLITIAVVFFIIPVALSLMAGLSIPTWPSEQYQDAVNGWSPPAATIQDQVVAYQGGWMEQMPARVKMAAFMQTFLFLWESLWRVTAMMVLGMALYKTGVLSAKRSTQFYWRLTGIGLITGWVLTGTGIQQNFNADWYYDYSMFFGSQYNYIGSVATSLGYIGIIMLISKSNGFKKIKTALSSVGKMAFTNYIFMSVFALFVFYGSGFGLFGQVERWEQVLFVIGIWGLILVFSTLWLNKFYYGPLEWVWRVLTYWHKQAFKKT